MRILLVAIILLIPAAARAQRAPFPIPDPDPEIERKSFIVADGFEVNLFAADPAIAKPIQMNFDPAGRLWIASSEVYPQIKPGQVADDKILVLEDRNGDGRSDKTSIFARGLLIPTGVEPGDGGAYVANSTELLHLADTDGDGQADRTRVVLSGFGTEDTHHILHTLRWGYDGALYFNQSVYIHSHIETPHGVRRLGGGGIWQFRPETMQLEVFIRGLVNPWGHHFDRWGQSFATDGAGGEGINYCIPGASFFWAVGAERIFPGLNPGSPKYCGLEVVSGRAMPESWQGNLLTNDFRGNRVCRFVLSDDGAGFAAREQTELIKTKHVAFRPIDIKMGPDGAIYIADWYNPIIQHGEVDFRDPRRDHTRGRIWRVSAKGRAPVDRPKLVGVETGALLDELKSPEQWTRDRARRALQERGSANVSGPLAAWVAALDPKNLMYDHHRLEALWTSEAVRQIDPALLGELLRSADPRVRAAAVRVVPGAREKLADPVEMLGERVLDENPRVRLEAVRALSAFPGVRSAERAMSALDRPVDRFLEYGLWLTARDLAPDWLPAMQAGRFDFGGHPERAVFALLAVGTPETVRPLLTLLRDGKVPRDQDPKVQDFIATKGGPAELGAVLDLVVRGEAIPASRRVALLDLLARASRQRKLVPAGDLAQIVSLLTGPDEALRASALRAAGAWDVPAIGGRLAELATAAETPRAVRAAAIEAIAQRREVAGRQTLVELAGRSGSTEIPSMALAALEGIDPADASPRIAAWLARLPVDRVDDGRRVLAAVLGRRDGASTLARAITMANVAISPDLAKLAIRQVRSSGHDEPALVAALSKAAKLDAAPKALNAAEMSALLTEVASQGNPSRGERIFRRKDLACLKCHAIAGAGGQVGPGLESIGASAPPDYLVDSILQPNKQVKEGYHATAVATDDGRIFTGIPIRKTDSELVLRDTEGNEVTLPTGSIVEQKMAGSIMPAGLADELTRPELVDLVRFLTELGKVGGSSVGTKRVLRRWEVAEGPSWRPAYTTVAGLLPPDEWKAPGQARTMLQASIGGPVQLAVEPAHASGLAFSIDGKPITPEADGNLRVDLKPGTHTLNVAIPAGLHEGIRVVLEEIPGSPARVQAVLGK